MQEKALRSAELLDAYFESDGLTPAAGPHADYALDPTQRTAEHVVGARKLLALLPQLQQLRARYGQQHDLTTDPEHFVATHTVQRRRVRAALIYYGPELEACVLFFEHCVLGLGLGLVRGGDALGGSFVIGKRQFSVAYIHLAAQSLLRQRRVHGISLTVKETREGCTRLMGPEGKDCLYSERSPVHTLRLADTYQTMLAGMGHRTRRSLSVKRRQLEQKAGVIFLSHLKPGQALEAMEALRTTSRPRRPSSFCKARHHLLGGRSEMFTMGLCLPCGRWLSIVSGWRRDGITYVDLQMNNGQFGKESISAVMRAYVLEHEIALQQHSMVFVGGCSILLGRYCEPGETGTDVVLLRPGVRSAVFKRMLPLLKPKSRYERLTK